MKAILSDIHANLEALQAVVADMARHEVEQVYCLGDVIGYGPNPRECLDLVMQWPVVLLGNHDQAAIHEPVGFSPPARRSAQWTRKVLDILTDPPEEGERRWTFLVKRPHTHQEKDFLYVHGSPRHPITEYIFPEDVYNPRKMDAIFTLVERYCFQGHTHIPGIFTEALQFFSPEEFQSTYTLGKHKVLCNVGSVGQSRDGDYRASYVLLDYKTLHFRRVEYDVETTLAKIRAIPDLSGPAK